MCCIASGDSLISLAQSRGSLIGKEMDFGLNDRVQFLAGVFLSRPALGAERIVIQSPRFSAALTPLPHSQWLGA
jgi:hypothetical protein